MEILSQQHESNPSLPSTPLQNSGSENETMSDHQVYIFQDPLPENYSNIVSYQWFNKHRCFGVAVASKIILTSAQCVANMQCKAFSVEDRRIVTFILEIVEPDDFQIYNILSFSIHPHCKFDSKSKLWVNDFATITLTKSLARDPFVKYGVPMYSKDSDTIVHGLPDVEECHTLGFVLDVGSGPKKTKLIPLALISLQDCLNKFIENGHGNSVRALLSNFVLPLICADIVIDNDQTNSRKLLHLKLDASGSPLYCDNNIWGIFSAHKYSLKFPKTISLIREHGFILGNGGLQFNNYLSNISIMTILIYKAV